MIRAEASGEEAPELVTQRTELSLTADAYAVRFAGEIMDRGALEIGEATAAPSCAFVLRGTRGPNAGRVIPCIYQLKGDRLRICFGLDGVAPTQFATTTGDARYLATYRRKPA